MYHYSLRAVFVSVLAVLISCPASGQIKHEGVYNRNKQKVERNVSSFTSIDKSGSLDLILLQAPREKVTVIAQKSVRPYIVTDTKNGVLYIQLKKPDLNLWKFHQPSVCVAFNRLKKIIANGSGKVEARDTLFLQDLTVNKAGSGDMKLLIKADQLIINKSSSGDMSICGHIENFTLKAHGSGNVDLEGAAGKSNIFMSGSGDLEGRMFNVQNMILSRSGSGDAKVWVDGTLSLYSVGSGEVHYKGNAKIRLLKKREAGDVVKE